MLSKQGDSNTRKDILHQHDEVPHLIRFSVGNGQNINFRYDPWVDYGLLVDILGWDVMQQIGFSLEMVSTSINQGA